MLYVGPTKYPKRYFVFLTIVIVVARLVGWLVGVLFVWLVGVLDTQKWVSSNQSVTINTVLYLITVRPLFKKLHSPVKHNCTNLCKYRVSKKYLYHFDF